MTTPVKQVRHKRHSMRGFTTEPRELAFLALESLVRYRLSGLAHEGEHMHEEMALRLRQAGSRNAW